jgi:molybdopterin/thiamine biosynthesis adenylyltransferase
MSLDQRPALLTKETDVVVLRASHPELVEVDAFDRQIKELFFIDNRSFIGSPKEESYATEDFKKYASSKEDAFVYVYFPWLNTLVKTVGADDYYTLKTNRNQDLITAEEQKKLRDYKVAVLGMSVGSNIAFVLTQAGISNRIVLADFDELDTTNLNRILAGVHEVGLNKTVVAAHRVYEDNPFADVTTLPEGVNETNLEELIKAGHVNCIVEEIDDIPFKIHARLLAMRYKIPVVMVTDNGDGIVLHVERYDLGHDKIWGKPHSYYEEKLAEGPMTKEKAGGIIMQDIVGGVHRVDSNMIASVKRVLARELVSWSQLGSAAILGAVVATYAIKRIALREAGEKDIRAWISPESVELGSHAA